MEVGTSQQLSKIHSHNSFYKKLKWGYSRSNVQLREFSHMAGLQSRLQDVDAMANPGKRDSSLKGRWRHRVGTIWSLDNFADVWHFQQRAGRDRKNKPEPLMCWLHWLAAPVMLTGWKVKITVRAGITEPSRAAMRQRVFRGLSQFFCVNIKTLTFTTYNIYRCKCESICFRP